MFTVKCRGEQKDFLKSTLKNIPFFKTVFSDKDAKEVDIKMVPFRFIVILADHFREETKLSLVAHKLEELYDMDKIIKFTLYFGFDEYTFISNNTIEELNMITIYCRGEKRRYHIHTCKTIPIFKERIEQHKKEHRSIRKINYH